MKTLFLMVSTLFISTCVFATQDVISAPVSKIFVPSGFDSNDNVELLVKGTFPDTCYSRNNYSLSVDQDLINITITAFRNNEAECERIEIPYMENITVGTLQAGKYRVVVNGKLQSQLLIHEAVSRNVDDHLYGMVQYVELGITGGVNGSFFLVGKNVSCLTLERVELLSNGKDTLSVLPIMKKKSENCQGPRKQFSIPVNFKINSLRANEVLIFVRTMDGKSVHTLIER